jgi:hypothetical protein
LFICLYDDIISQYTHCKSNTIIKLNFVCQKRYQLADLPSPRSALDVVSIEDAADLAERLLGVHRGQAKLVSRDRDRHQPEYGCKPPPNAELPAGQPCGAVTDDDDVEDTEWENVLDPFGLALIMPTSIDNNDDGGGAWAAFRLFGVPSDASAGPNDDEDMEWEDEETDFEDAEEDPLGDWDSDF